MIGAVIGFIIWSIVGCLFIFFGVCSYFAKKPMGFWANAKVPEVTDVKKYNHALAKLYSIYGVVLIFLGIPLLLGQNSPWILLSVVGVMFETIVIMVVYTVVIEKKYKK